MYLYYSVFIGIRNPSFLNFHNFHLIDWLQINNIDDYILVLASETHTLQSTTIPR